VTTPFNIKYYKLGIDFEGLVLEDGVEYTLLIDRWRNQEKVKISTGTTRKSKYYHELERDAITNNRLNEIPITSVNGQYFDFTPLSYFNKFTVFSGTSAYQNLPLQYQVGPGLKNFGWAIDATITGFTQSLVENDLNAYLTNVLSGSKIYTFTEPTDITEGSIYTLQDFEGCWEYTGYRLDGQPAYPEITTLNEFGSCFDCENNETPLTVQFKYNGDCLFCGMNEKERELSMPTTPDKEQKCIKCGRNESDCIFNRCFCNLSIVYFRKSIKCIFKRCNSFWSWGRSLLAH
jgi:hypothetical protein